MDAAGLKPGDVKHGTFDLSPEIIARIKDGTTMFGIDQQPFLQGYGAVQTLMLKIRYGISPALPVTPTGPGFVDAGNVTIVEELAGEYR
jgi:simple sugar transport system substrate-binding protein